MLQERHVLKNKLVHLFTNSINDISVHFQIDIIELICSDHEESKLFNQNPSFYLNQLLLYLQKELINESLSDKNLSEQKQLQIARRLQNTHVMFSCIPFTTKIYKQFSQINSEDVGRWIVVTGTVIQSTTKKTLEKSKSFECTRCQHKYRLRTTYQNGYNFETPFECTNQVLKDKSENFFNKYFQYKKPKDQQDKDKNKNTKTLQKCGCSKFDPLQQGKICIDYQELRMQEQFQYISSGKIPQTIIVIIEGDFENGGIFRPGDDLTITGLLTYRYIKLKKDFIVPLQLVIYSNNIVVQKANKQSIDDGLSEMDSIVLTQQQLYNSKSFNKLSSSFYEEYTLNKQQIALVKQLQFRKEIINTFCPGIYGRDMIKLGLLLSLLGGVSIENQNSKIRGNSHVLLVGEPGTGKSVLLKQISKLSSRSFFTNGIGTTSAGLSVSYYKDGSEWTIEAGALVLADNGICCIDELTLLSKKDEKSLLEAMEQQTISSAKASVIGKLNARTTVICACNPIRSGQKYDDELDLQANTGLSIPLLTRFDMIFIMKDEHNISQDAQKCDHILQNFTYSEADTYLKHKNEPQKINLRSLLQQSKDLSPQLNNHEIFSVYYTEERKRDSKVKTARAFESLCRIAEAHAKLMLREQTNQFDCITAIMLAQNRFLSTLEQYYEYLEQFNEKYHLRLT